MLFYKEDLFFNISGMTNSAEVNKNSVSFVLITYHLISFIINVSSTNYKCL